MGLFDEVTFEKGLLPPDVPEFAKAPGHRFQTKSFCNPFLVQYTITKDGQLLRLRQKNDATPEEPPSAAIPVDFHGDLVVYTSNWAMMAAGHVFTHDGEDYETVTLRVRFTNDRLERIEITRLERAPALRARDFKPHEVTPELVAEKLAERNTKE